MILRTEPNLRDPDKMYQTIIDTFENVPDKEAMALSARLILLLVNHIGEEDVVEEAIAAALSVTD